MKLQLYKDDFQKMVQDYVNYYFDKSGTTVTDIVFTGADGRQFAVTKMEVGFTNNEN